MEVDKVMDVLGREFARERLGESKKEKGWVEGEYLRLALFEGREGASNRASIW